jgi:hypothetical protein
MANPQQPELRRSERNEALSPDATHGRQYARRPLASDGDLGPVPESNRAGHHDEHDQDKPDLDAMAERLGIPPAGEPDAFPEPARTAPRTGVARAPRPDTDARSRPEPGSVAARWAGVVRAGATLTFGPWIVIGRLAEHARDAVDRRVSPS